MEKARQIGKQILSSVTTEKYCRKYDKYIYRWAEKTDDCKQNYLEAIYQTVGFLLQKDKNAGQILSQIKEGNLGWKSPMYDKISSLITEHDDYLVSPFEVVDGVIKCPRCEGYKTWSVQRQTRAADEPMTTFSHCVLCDYKWRYSG
jgi:hypothetical protein